MMAEEASWPHCYTYFLNKSFPLKVWSVLWRKVLPDSKKISLLNLSCVDLKATAGSRELSLKIHLTKRDSLRIFITQRTANLLWEPIWEKICMSMSCYYAL